MQGKMHLPEQKTCSFLPAQLHILRPPTQNWVQQLISGKSEVERDSNCLVAGLKPLWVPWVYHMLYHTSDLVFVKRVKC